MKAYKEFQRIILFINKKLIAILFLKIPPKVMISGQLSDIHVSIYATRNTYRCNYTTNNGSISLVFIGKLVPSVQFATNPHWNSC